MTDEQLRELGKQLPYDHPDASRREALRSSLLVAATRPEPTATRKRWWLAGGAFAAGALAAAAAIFIIIVRDPERTVHATAQARIDAAPSAQLEHVVASTATGIDEVVRVRDGVVRVAVPSPLTKSRVRTQTGDAEVEATGAYEVAVVDDRLERVTVTTGTARITVRHQQPVFLAAGQTWRPRIITADVTPAPPAATASTAPATSTSSSTSNTRTSQRPKAPSNSTPAADENVELPRMPAVTTLDASQPTATEKHFQRGWALLREGKANEAAAELALAAQGSDALADDARYFQAVALVRAGRAVEAERVLIGFLTRAPESLRAGRAALLLGKLLRERGEVDAARRWFETALHDPDPAIASAAKGHVSALP